MEERYRERVKEMKEGLMKQIEEKVAKEMKRMMKPFEEHIITFMKDSQINKEIDKDIPSLVSRILSSKGSAANISIIPKI